MQRAHTVHLGAGRQDGQCKGLTPADDGTPLVINSVNLPSDRMGIPRQSWVPYRDRMRRTVDGGRIVFILSCSRATILASMVISRFERGNDQREMDLA